MHDEALRELCLLGDWRLSDLLLARLPQRNAVERLTAELGQPDEHVRLETLAVLCRALLIDESAFESLLGLALDDGSAAVRRSAWVVLRRHARALVEALVRGDRPELAAALGAPECAECLWGERLAGLHADHVCPPLAAYLPTAAELFDHYQAAETDETRRALIMLLGRSGEGLAAPLAALLEDAEEAHSLLALKLIGRFRVRSLLPAVEQRAALLSGCSREVKRAAKQTAVELNAAPDSTDAEVAAEHAHWWTEALDGLVAGLESELDGLDVFSGALHETDGTPRPWQEVFGGGTPPNGEPLLGRPFRASARVTCSDLLRIVREELIQQWHMAAHAFGESTRRPRLGVHRTAGGHVLTSLDIPAAEGMNRCALVCRVGADDYLFWAVGAGREDPTRWQPFSVG